MDKLGHLFWSSFPLIAFNPGQDAVFKPPTAGYGAAPPAAVCWGRCGERQPGGRSNCGKHPHGTGGWESHSVVRPWQLWDGVRHYDLAPGAVRWICGELCDAAAEQELLVLTAEWGCLQLPGCACTGLACAHHVDRPGKDVMEGKTGRKQQWQFKVKKTIATDTIKFLQLETTMSWL